MEIKKILITLLIIIFSNSLTFAAATDREYTTGTSTDINERVDGIQKATTLLENDLYKMNIDLKDNINQVNSNINSVSERLDGVQQATALLEDDSYKQQQQIKDNNKAISTNANSINNINNRVNNIDHRLNKLDNKLESGLATVTALTSLHPNPKASGKTQIAVGSGIYRDNVAGAIGVFHHFKDNFMMSVGAAYGGEDSWAGNVGFTFSFGR